MTHLSIKNLTKVYQGSTVPSLKNLSLEINSGTLTSIIGPSGSGKTTLGMAILRMLPSVSLHEHS